MEAHSATEQTWRLSHMSRSRAEKEIMEGHAEEEETGNDVCWMEVRAEMFFSQRRLSFQGMC